MPEAPDAHDFLEQLLPQVLDDLDGILCTEGSARELLYAAGRDGRLRAATLLTLARAGLIAHRALIDNNEPDADVADTDTALRVLGELLGGALPPDAMRKHAQQQRDFMAVAEPESADPEVNLARAIVRLYSGLGRGDDALGARGLHELRALTVHLDAVACVAAAGGTADQPVPVVRPDRFHDAFMQLSDAIRKGDEDAGESPVAALGRDGRITALLNDRAHPLARAVTAATERLGDDEAIRDAGSRRLVALLLVIDAIRRGDRPADDGLLEDLPRFVGLITAAATAPLLEHGFDADVLMRIAGYNARLMQPPANALKR